MRTYGEVIDVRTVPAAAARPGGGSAPGEHQLEHSAAPEQFLWRGRVYLVREVLAHWIELGSWWSVRGPHPDPSVGPVDGPLGLLAGVDPAAVLPAPRSVAADVGAVERVVWRVEAAAGRSATPGVYDLVHDHSAHAHARDRDLREVDVLAPGRSGPGDPPAGRWRLARALD